MRKKLLIGLAAALIAVFALSSVALASVSISGGPSTVDYGDTVTITITGTGEGVNGNVQTSGLELIDGPSNSLSSAGVFVLLPEYGNASVSYTYRVTAQSGQVSVRLTGVTQAVGDTTESIDGDSWTATVNAAPTQEPSQQPTQEPSQQPTQEPSATVSATASASASASGSAVPGGSKAPSGSVKPGTTGNQDKMPKTGDATMDLWVLAVVAAGAACTALVAGKKVFSR